jgi:hypothetical protein
LEVVDRPTIEMRENVPVVVVSVKVNINQKSKTIEEILCQRKQTAIDIGDAVINEIEFDTKFVSSIPWPEARFREDLSVLFEHDDEWFNSDINFQSTINEIITLKKDTIQTFVIDCLKESDQNVSSEQKVMHSC